MRPPTPPHPANHLARDDEMAASRCRKDRGGPHAEAEYQEDVAEYEALPAEEKLAYYKAGGLTPPRNWSSKRRRTAARQQTEDPQRAVP